MSFVLASSRLPELEHPADEEEEDDVQPMQRSGMVRAFSHLPQRVQGAPAAPRPSAPLPASRPAWAAAPDPPSGHAHADGHDPEPDDTHGTSAGTGPHGPEDNRPWYLPRITAADLQPEGGEHDDPAPGSAGRAPKKWEPEHAPDPGFDGTPPKAWGQPTRDPGFDATPPKEWGMPTRDPGFDASPQDVHNGPPAPDTPAPDTTVAAPAQRRAPFPQSRLFEKRPTPGFSAPTGRPVLNDLVYRAQGEPPANPEFNDLVYRFNGSPEEAREDARSFSQNVADVYGSSPLLAAQGAALSQGESPRPAGNPAPPSSSQEKFQQSSPQTPAASPDKTTPQQPVQNVESPYEELRDYLKKSKNPLFIKDYYDHRTPLEEKLRLRQLILSLRAPAGENLPLYIQHLQHWFNAKNRPPVDQDGKEEPVTHPLKDLMQWPVVKEAYDKVMYRFGSLPDGKLDHKTIFDWVRAHPDATKPGGVAVPDTYWDATVDGSHPDPVKKLFGLPKPGNEGYFYAFGRAAMTAKSSGVRGLVDNDGGVRFRGTFNARLHDKYDWNLDQGTSLRPDPKIPMDKIRQYIPKDIPVISPKGEEIQISDSFFKEMLEKGYGRDYDLEAPKEPVTLEFYQAKPGGPFQYKEIPRTP